jgi:hypothetical protein
MEDRRRKREEKRLINGKLKRDIDYRRMKAYKRKEEKRT